MNDDGRIYSIINVKQIFNFAKNSFKQALKLMAKGETFLLQKFGKQNVI